MVSIARLPDESIIIVTPRSTLTAYFQDLHRIHPQIDRIASEVTPPLYEIINVCHTDITYSDILIWLYTYQNPPPGSARDSRIRPVIVGDHPLIDVGIKKVQQHIGLSIPRYDTLDAALTAIRAEQANVPAVW